jgi:capsular polysaccharide transport system permease protein
MSIIREGSKPRVSPLLMVLRQKSGESSGAAEKLPEERPVGEVAELHERKPGGLWTDDIPKSIPPFNFDWRLWSGALVKMAKERSIFASFLIMVAGPTLIALIYYLFIASNQYVTEIKFALRSMDRNNVHASVGAMGVPSAVTGIADSFILADFITTRQLVDELERKVGLRKILSNPAGDFFSRLGSSASVEQVVDHWRSMVKSRYELSTGILSVQVRAYTPQDSLALANAVIGSAERLANELTGNGRQGLVEVAEADLKKAESQLSKTNDALLNHSDQSAGRAMRENERAQAEREYSNAVTALRSAQALADRQQMYLATFAKPALPESSRYPDRLGSIGLVAGMALLSWIVLLLIFMGIRDHMR